MTRTICLAAFFLVILVMVFWFTRSRGTNEKGRPDSLLQMLAPRVQVITSDREGGPSKFQLAISTDPSPLSQMNREAVSVAKRVRPSVVLVNITCKEEANGKARKKAAGSKPVEWTSNGILIGSGDEVAVVIPPEVVPSEVNIRFQDGSTQKADFIGRDDESQIALLRLPSVATAKPLVWRNRRTVEWGEHFYAIDWDAVHGSQMARVMVSGDALLFSTDGKTVPRHFHQLDQVLSPDFLGAVLVDGNGEVAGLVIEPDAPDQLRALVLDAGAVRVAMEALRSLEKK